MRRSVRKSFQILGLKVSIDAASLDRGVLEILILKTLFLKALFFKTLFSRHCFQDTVSKGWFLFNLCSSQGSPEDEEAELLVVGLVHGLGHGSFDVK